MGQEVSALQEAADALRAVLAAIDSGELACSAAMRHRLEGAALALEVEAATVSQTSVCETVRSCV